MHTADDLDLETYRRAGLSALLDELVLGPVRILREYLKALPYIGPLRDSPYEQVGPTLQIDEHGLTHGKAVRPARAGCYSEGQGAGQ